MLSSTLIDLTFINTPDRVVCSGVSHIGISDHTLVFAFRKVPIESTKILFLFIYYICHFTINLDLIIKVKIRNMARKPKRNQGGLYEVRFPHKSEIIKYTNIAEQSVQLGVTQE